jgi:hypothetical protein
MMQLRVFNPVRLGMSGLGARFAVSEKQKNGCGEPKHSHNGKQAINFNQLTFTGKTIHAGGSILPGMKFPMYK